MQYMQDQMVLLKKLKQEANKIMIMKLVDCWEY